MKNLLLFVATCLLCGTAFSQIKPTKGDVGLGFRLTGLEDVAFSQFDSGSFGTPQLLGRYYLTERLSLRIALGIDYNNSEESFTRSYLDSTNFDRTLRIDSQFVNTESSSSYAITPGIEYHLLSQATKLDPYVGATVPIAILGPEVTETEEDYTRRDEAAGQQTFARNIDTRNEREGGLSVGLNLLAGFNYFFTDNMAIGAEYALGFGFQSVGGDVTSSTAGTINPSTDPTDVTTVNTSRVFSQESSTLSAGLRSTGGIIFSIFW